MITDIARMLQAQEPNSDAGHRARFAIIIEKSFFRSATSFEEYSDRGTLTTRLQALIDTLRAQKQQQAAGPAPAPAAPPTPVPKLSIRFHKVTEGEITIWPINPTAKLQQVFDTYTLKYRASVRGQPLLFFLDGALLNGDQTPEDVDMEDGDQIDVYGSDECSPAPKRPRHK